MESLPLLSETGIEIFRSLDIGFLQVESQAVNNRFHTDITGRSQRISVRSLVQFVLLHRKSQSFSRQLLSDPHLFPQMGQKTVEHHMKISPIHFPPSPAVQAAQIPGIIIDPHAVGTQFSVCSPITYVKADSATSKKRQMDIEFFSGRYKESCCRHPLFSFPFPWPYFLSL